MTNIQDFSGYPPTWCPGCGNHGIGIGLKTALVQLNLDPSSVFVAFGIGCSGNMNDFLNAYVVHGLHGRAIPLAIGMKLANHKMPVIVVAGDGDCYGEGGNHFLHACRGNHNITVIVHDNRVYGLTTGQSAPTAKKGYRSKSTPTGIIEISLNPLTLALTQGATFVAQTFAGDASHMIEIIKQGIQHKGFSLINVLQPCVTFNKVNTYQYYQKKVFKLGENYKKSDLRSALEAAQGNRDEKYPLGILFQEERLTFTDQLSQIQKGKTLLQNERFSAFDDLFKEFS